MQMNFLWQWPMCPVKNSSILLTFAKVSRWVPFSRSFANPSVGSGVDADE